VYVGYGATVACGVAVGTVVGNCVAEGSGVGTGVGVAKVGLARQQQQPLADSARPMIRIIHKILPFISILLELLYSL
jgi:hypothetical protein